MTKNLGNDLIQRWKELRTLPGLAPCMTFQCCQTWKCQLKWIMPLTFLFLNSVSFTQNIEYAKYVVIKYCQCNNHAPRPDHIRIPKKLPQ